MLYCACIRYNILVCVILYNMLVYVCIVHASGIQFNQCSMFSDDSHLDVDDDEVGGDGEDVLGGGKRRRNRSPKGPPSRYLE